MTNPPALPCLASPLPPTVLVVAQVLAGIVGAAVAEVGAAPLTTSAAAAGAAALAVAAVAAFAATRGAQ